MRNRAIGVSILTNGTRLDRLKKCVQSLIENCYYRPLVLAVFDNGSKDDTHEWLKEQAADPGYGLEWRLERSNKDVGCASGSNRVAEMVRDCEYVLHLESDFEHLPEYLTGEDKMWLHRAVEFMDADVCDYLYLRRMVSHEDIFEHMWSNWMPRLELDNSEPPYLPCPDFWWSNNPHLRRNDAIYGIGSLPLDEAKDGKKGEPGWSQPELCAPPPGRTWIHQWGLFVHELSSCEGLASRRGCGKFSAIAGVTCKYGFFKDGSDRWCQYCYAEEDFCDMPKHVNRFRELM